MIKSWKTEEVNNFGDIITGSTPRTSVDEYWNGTIPWITPTDIGAKRDIYHSIREITPKGLQAIRTLPADTLIVTCIASIGKNVILRKAGASNQQTNAIIPNSNYSVEYLYYLFEYNKNYLLSRAGITATNIISKQDFSELLFNVPNKDEQTSIANALSDADEWINALEKLIEKKKLIKQGVMQDLLTGKIRLPGFTDKWVEKQIQNIGTFYSGLTSKSATDFGHGNSQYITFLNVLNNTIIDTSMLEKVSLHPNEQQNAVENGDLFFNGSSETPEEVGMCSVLLEDLENTYLNSFCFGLRLKDKEVDPIFISYLFNSEIGRNIMILLAQGATRYNLPKQMFKETSIELPSKDEQAAIAEILSDIDAEIEKLSKQLEKSKQIKIGMSQQLLTGKIRLLSETELEKEKKFADSVVISKIVSVWGREPEKYPLGRVKVNKLFYLYTRKLDGDVSRFAEMAAGPYDSTIRHGGGEEIAINNGFISVSDRESEDGSKFTIGTNIENAEKYIIDMEDIEAFSWLEENFKSYSRDELELLATVDNARIKLEQSGKDATTNNIITYIKSSPEWAKKLTLSHFTRVNISQALKQSKQIFAGGNEQ